MKLLNLCGIAALLFVQVNAFAQLEYNVAKKNGVSNVDISDMVVHSTGDLYYNLPLFSIVSPKGQLPITLNYRPGISLNSESSWVGLGWSLDVGKIMRHVSQIPDDYKGEKILTKQYDPGDTETIETPKYFEALKDALNRKGNSITRKFRNSFYSGGGPAGALNFHTYMEIQEFIGLATSFTGGISVSSGVGSTGAGTAGEWGDGGAANTGAGCEGGGGVGVNPITLFKMIMGPKVNFPQLTSWDWNIETESEKRKILFFEIDWDKSVKYRWWLDDLKHEKGYGLLYHSDIPFNTGESGSPSYFNPSFLDPADNQSLNFMNLPLLQDNLVRSIDAGSYTSDYYQQESEDPIYKNVNPVYLASDFYGVSSFDLQGEMKPLRFDNPSMATSFISNVFYGDRISLYKHKIAPSQTGRVQFAMVNERSNSYLHHKTSFNGNYDLNYAVKPYENLNNAQQSQASALRLNDQSEGFTTSKTQDSTFNGNNILYKANYIKWFTNKEIIDKVASNEGFIDYPNLFRGSFRESLIGGFLITDPQGYTYHFAIPVMTNVKHTTVIGTTTLTNYYEYDFPTTWLLTAITGPDFQDNGTYAGEIDDNDKGFFVKFEYGRYQEGFENRYPKSGESYTPEDAELQANKMETSDVYYLNAVITRSTTALFVKSFRSDNVQNQKGSLFLKEIVILNNEDMKMLLSSGLSFGSNVPGYLSSSQSNVLKWEDIYSKANIKALVDKMALHKIILDYDNTLCTGFPGAGTGKLALRKVHFLGKGDKALMPPYLFDYAGLNPAYNQESWDGWGLYKANEVKGVDTHGVDNGTDGAAWSLTKITTPLGANIQIDYERDKYASVSGLPLEEGVSEKWGGDLRVKSIRSVVGDKVLTHFKYDYTLDGEHSSGVATLEPPFCRKLERPIDDIFNYPAPVVTYSKVRKYKVSSVDNTKFEKVIEYNFQTADESIVQVKPLINKTVHVTSDSRQEGEWRGHDMKEFISETTYKDDKIGLINSIKNLDAAGNTVASIDYSYEPSELGSYTQASHLFDNTFRIYDKQPTAENRTDKRMTYRFLMNIESRIPHRLKSIVHANKLGVTTRSENLSFDYFTGESLEILDSDSYGNRYITRQVPAYKIKAEGGVGPYAAMGLKAGNNQYRNILYQPAVSNRYKVTATNEVLGLVSATVQTWTDQLPILNSSIQTNVWRPHKSFHWNGLRPLKKDGTYEIEHFKRFNFNSDLSANSEWEPTEEITLYDTYSQVLERKDVNAISTATLTAPQSFKTIAVADNASAYEIAFSGAEYYGKAAGTEGGVDKGEGNPSMSHVHTGKFSLLVGFGSKGFNYTLNLKPTDAGKKYRASVWVYAPGEAETQAELNQIELYYIANDVVHKIHPQLNKTKSKSWYLLSIDILPEGENEIYVGCKNNSSRGVYFDDFRVHPLNSFMTTYVYDQTSDELLFVHDKNNFYTKFEYDAMGQIIRTSRELLNFDFGEGKESFRADKITSEVKYNYGRKDN